MEAPVYKDIFKQLFKNLQWSGIPSDGSRLGIRFYIQLTIMTFMITEEAAFIINKASPENFLLVTALAPCLGFGVRAALKVACIAQKRRKIFELTKSLEEPYLEIVSDEAKRDLVCGEIIRLKSFTKYYILLNLALSVVYCLFPLIIIIYEYFTKGILVLSLPYQILVPLSTEVFQNWLIFYIQGIICAFVSIFYVTAADGLYCNIATQVCANYRVLSYEIENLNPSNTHTLPDIVKKHQYIYKLSEDLDDTFTVCNFFNIFMGAIEICAIGFNITFGEWRMLPIFVLFMSSELLQILIMSIFGENIITESTRIGDAAFSSEWYNMDKKSKAFILTIMIRQASTFVDVATNISQKPQIITAYKYSTISYKTFTTIIRSSWSYFAILRTVYNPNK